MGTNLNDTAFAIRPKDRGSAEPRQLIRVSRWRNLSWLELGSNLRSTLNLVQLNRDLIDVGETRLKRRVVRQRNFACRRVPTMYRTCAGFYIYSGRRYKKWHFPQMRAYFCCRDLRSVSGTWAVGQYQPAGWLAAAAQGLCITINSTGLAAAAAQRAATDCLLYKKAMLSQGNRAMPL